MASKMSNGQKLSKNSASSQRTMIETIKNNTASVLDIMNYYFRYTTYKTPTQDEAINMILSYSNDVVVSMPDGYGRSLCYKLPAVVKTPKVTIVFCPLIPRIQRHLSNLSRVKIFTKALTTETDIKKRSHIINEVSQRTSSSTIFYATPNEADAKDFQEFLKLLIQANRLAYIVVDEVHSEDQWLYGQKKNYKSLGTIREMYPTIPWIIVTSEIGDEVVNMMKKTLNLKTNVFGNVSRFATSCDRPNIFYDVIHDNINGQSYGHLKLFIKKCIEDENNNKPVNKSCGIIFCKTRNAANVLSASIQVDDIAIVPYHPGLSERQQLSVRNSFMKGSIKVIVVAGNIGKTINNVNIRFAVHWGIPASITQYYKETGLAGKDGQVARCRIYDTENSLSYFNETTEEQLKAISEAEIEGDSRNALTSYLIFVQSRLMKDYCFSDKCRHSFLAFHFGEIRQRCINKCDICVEEGHMFYTGRALIKKTIEDVGLETFIKKVIAKYESHGPTQISTNATLNLLKICDELINTSEIECSADVLNMFNEWRNKLMLVKYQAQEDSTSV